MKGDVLGKREKREERRGRGGEREEEVPARAQSKGRFVRDEKVRLKKGIGSQGEEIS